MLRITGRHGDFQDKPQILALACLAQRSLDVLHVAKGLADLRLRRLVPPRQLGAVHRLDGFPLAQTFRYYFPSQIVTDSLT